MILVVLRFWGFLGRLNSLLIKGCSDHMIIIRKTHHYISSLACLTRYKYEFFRNVFFPKLVNRCFPKNIFPNALFLKKISLVGIRNLGLTKISGNDMLAAGLVPKGLVRLIILK